MLRSSLVLLALVAAHGLPTPHRRSARAAESAERRIANARALDAEFDALSRDLEIEAHAPAHKHETRVHHPAHEYKQRAAGVGAYAPPAEIEGGHFRRAVDGDYKHGVAGAADLERGGFKGPRSHGLEGEERIARRASDAEVGALSRDLEDIEALMAAAETGEVRATAARTRRARGEPLAQEADDGRFERMDKKTSRADKFFKGMTTEETKKEQLVKLRQARETRHFYVEYTPKNKN